MYHTMIIDDKTSLLAFTTFLVILPFQISASDNLKAAKQIDL